jgi:peptide/nickel transport system substrate-binding protein
LTVYEEVRFVTTRRRGVKLLSALAAFTLLATACGGDDDDSSSNAGSDATTTTAEGGSDAGGQQGGTLTLGAEQFPECINPVSQCANSSWMHWAVDQYVLPKLMTLSPGGDYIPSPLLDGDPELAGEGIDDSGDPFSVTYTLKDDANWAPSGDPITCTDVAFTWQAIMDTTASLTIVGWDRVKSVEATDDNDKVCKITFTEPVAAWGDLGGSSQQYVLDHNESDVGKTFDVDAANGETDNEAAEGAKAETLNQGESVVMDIANEMNNDITYSGGPFVLDSFDAAGGQASFTRNDDYWDDETMPLLDGFNVVAEADSDTELNALLAGEVAAIYPQPAPGIADTLDGGDTVDYKFGAGTTFEGLWFNMGSLSNPNTPLKDPAVREALLFAVDREDILAEVITPSFPDVEILNCGGWVPTVGDWCDNTDFADATFDPAKVASILEGAGWAKGSDGIYAKDGNRLSIKWQTVAGNARRESIQQLEVPALKELGIEVVPDNQDADTLFQVSLPQMQTEIGLYAQVASPDPSVTTIFDCSNIPSEANGFAGQNNTGWCNEEASQLMEESDRTPDPDERLDLIHQIGDFVRQDAVWLPFYQLPLITAWDTAQVAGPVGDYTDSPLSGFYNIYDWSVAN